MMEALSACFLASSSWPDLRIEALDAGPSTISPDYLQVAPATATFFRRLRDMAIIARDGPCHRL